MPFNQLLGLRLSRVHTDGVTVECPLRAELMNGAGVLHGGVGATLADAAVGIAISRHTGGKRRITTVELKVNYFRPVLKGKIRARAHLLRVGKHLCCGRVDLTDDDKNLVGTAIATYMFVDAS